MGSVIIKTFVMFSILYRPLESTFYNVFYSCDSIPVCEGVRNVLCFLLQHNISVCLFCGGGYSGYSGYSAHSTVFLFRYGAHYTVGSGLLNFVKLCCVV